MDPLHSRPSPLADDNRYAALGLIGVVGNKAVSGPVFLSFAEMGAGWGCDKSVS